VKHKADDGSESPYWALPGGGVDPMEPLHDAMAREIMEELGVTAIAGKLLFVQQFNSKREGFSEELEFFFHIKDSSAFDNLDLQTTTHGFSELSRVEFVDPKNVTILPPFFSTIDIEAYITSDLPAYIHTALKQ
jgi:8-oxo-dGTP pyrophosphatase MutT (NUDIX family)